MPTDEQPDTPRRRATDIAGAATDTSGDVDSEKLPTLDDAPVVRWLLGINIIVFAIDAWMRGSLHTVNGSYPVGMLTYYGNFNIPQAMNEWQLWRLFTYQFLHAHLLHLALNMMALFMFGPLMEKWWGGRRFLVFYLLCGACGAWLMAMLAYTPLLSMAGGLAGWLVGASGSIFGLLVGVALVAPKLEVQLIFPPIWLTVRKLAFVFGLISLGGLLIDWNGGGNAAHLGGALFGYILVKRPWSLDWADRRAPKLDPPGEAGDAPAGDANNGPGEDQ